MNTEPKTNETPKQSFGAKVNGTLKNMTEKAGEMAGAPEKMKEFTQNAHERATDVKGFLGTLMGLGKSLLGWIFKIGKEVKEVGTDGLSKTMSDVTNVAKDGYADMKAKVNTDEVQHAFSQAKELAAQGLEKAKAGVAVVASKVEDLAEQGMEKAKDVAHTATETVKDVAEKGKDMAGNVAEKVEDAGQSVADNVKSAGKHVYGQAKNASETVAKKISQDGPNDSNNA